MKTIFLGAGASCSAGYPTSSGLLVELKDWAASSRDSSVADSWNVFSRFREEVPEPLRTVVNSSNPEIILSAFDLLGLASETSRSDRWNCAENPYPSETEPSEFPEAGLALSGFRRCLDSYFGHRHSNDAGLPETHDKRRPLRDALAALSLNDVVITTNWDALAERILAEEGRWNPGDGYGFRVQLQDKKTRNPPEAGCAPRMYS